MEYEMKMNEWISVNDRLPGDDKILCWTDRGIFMYELIETKWGNHYRCMGHEGGFASQPTWTHWMPLPTPPNNE